jgi:hypothetical protein
MLSDQERRELQALSRLLDYCREQAGMLPEKVYRGDRMLVLYTMDVAREALASAVKKAGVNTRVS